MKVVSSYAAVLTVVSILAVGGGSAVAHAQDEEVVPQFDHTKHALFFPICGTCHPGAVDPESTILPRPEFCAACHNGNVRPIVEWQPREGPRPTNLRFVHTDHAARVGDAVTCLQCHAEGGVRPVAQRCLDCHGINEEHQAAPDSVCAGCHLPLAEATTLPAERIAAFSAPPSHESLDFRLGGHGTAAASGDPVATSCATCHAREFCIVCHVDAPEQPVIQALGEDTRSLLIVAELKAPESHDDHDWVYRHGGTVRESASSCATCHTQQNCLECHRARPDVAASIAMAGPGRGAGAGVFRRPPRSHGVSFTSAHEMEAATAPATCAGCHVRSDCLDCHRPSQSRAAAAYHPADFLVRHPAAAFARETSCSDCHNVRSFCASCHEQSGLTAARQIGSGYHDAKRFFIAGHGQAARQSLESCVSCHTERDCLACHSAVGGRRFNPHGPGFDAERLRERVPQMCTVCHGAFIPEDN